MKTGTLTHVPDTFNSGIPSIFRLSFRSFCSSSVSSRSSSTKDPACGITLNAMVRGKDDGAAGTGTVANTGSIQVTFSRVAPDDGTTSVQTNETRGHCFS